MIEIPEAHTIAAQSPHGFAWYYGNPRAYDELLEGKTISVWHQLK